jgi:hypothetical protein
VVGRAHAGGCSHRRTWMGLAGAETAKNGCQNETAAKIQGPFSMACWRWGRTCALFSSPEYLFKGLVLPFGYSPLKIALIQTLSLNASSCMRAAACTDGLPPPESLLLVCVAAPPEACHP